MAYAKSKGKLITYDPNLRKPLWKDLNTAREQLTANSVRLHFRSIIKAVRQIHPDKIAVKNR